MNSLLERPLLADAGGYQMARRSSFVPRTQFQEWLNQALDRKGISLTELASRAESDYTHIWKIARGNPDKYPTSRRPGFELTETIGEILGDKEGALRAANYRKPDPKEKAQNKQPPELNRIIDSKGEITRTIDPDSIKILDAYEGLPEQDRRAVLEHARALSRVAREGYKERSDIIGKRSDIDDQPAELEDEYD